ncbi:hypothetical protein HMPREF1550_00149 [Actinomyces sp. oral taxon 877 str. F0543]|nr:hypothetical protein HMPREF1550_00149 [Actinomyces sp. oral taxon 877 str. F0543]
MALPARCGGQSLRSRDAPVARASRSGYRGRGLAQHGAPPL